MASSKDRFKKIVAQRKQRGDHYMTMEKFKAQMDFYKSVSYSAKSKNEQSSDKL